MNKNIEFNSHYLQFDDLFTDYIDTQTTVSMVGFCSVMCIAVFVVGSVFFLFFCRDLKRNQRQTVTFLLSSFVMCVKMSS